MVAPATVWAFFLQNMEDKALVDLQAVRRQVADQAQGGHAGAKPSSATRMSRERKN